VATPESSSSIAARPIAPSLRGESAPAEASTPWECLEQAREESAGEPLFLWEAPDGRSIAGIGAVARLTAAGPGRFEEMRIRLARLFGRASHQGTVPAGFPGAVAIGGFSFDEQAGRPGWPGFPDAAFHVPSRTFWNTPAGTIETRWSPDEEGAAESGFPEPELASAESWDRAAWLDAVRLTLDRIRAGAFTKVVLARSVDVVLERPADVGGIMATLRSAYPTCYRFLIADGRGNAFLGASPERLVRLAGREVLTEAVAGTQRCEPGEEGSALGRSLAASSKDRSEHGIVLRHLLDTLAPLCGALEAPESPEVMRLPHLLHLRTPVRGLVREGAHALDLVARIHPTPAIAGWPRSEALDWIRRVEGLSRGWYAGPIGWVNAAGEGDFAVGIRSIAIHAGVARIFAGAGIVEGSDPEQEWNETELKMRGILDALARD
jgi:menaquinone-specific isochorismate synthase